MTTRPKWLTGSIVAAALAISSLPLLSPPALAADPSAENPQPERTEVKVFDIRDIIDHASQRDPAPVQVGGAVQSPNGNGSMFTGGESSNAPSRDEIVRAILDTIQTSVAVETWRDHGGQLGAIRELHGQLIINQTPATLAQIEKIINALREQAELQVLVEVRIYAVDQKTLDAISAQPAILTVEQAARLLAPPADAKIKLLAAPRALVSSGSAAVQLTHFAEKNYIQSYTHNVAPADSDKTSQTQPAPRETSADAVIATVTGGSVFRTSATASADHSTITVHLSQTTATPTLSPEKITDTQPQKVLPTQTAAVERHGIDTSFTAPNGLYTILGGDRLHLSSPLSDDTENPFILYLARASIVTQPTSRPAKTKP